MTTMMRQSTLWTAEAYAGPVDFPVPTMIYVTAVTEGGARAKARKVFGPTEEGTITVKKIGPVYL